MLCLSCSSAKMSIPPPTKVDSYCNDHQLDTEALMRVIAAVQDVILKTNASDTPSLMRMMQSRGGAIASWTALRLPLPNLSSRYLPGHGVIEVRAAAVIDNTEGLYTQRLLFLVPRPKAGVYRWFDFQTGDREPICK
jgi:hypothetical protein